MKGNRTQRVLLACMAAVFFLSACGLPGELKKEAKQKPDQIEAARNVVSKLRDKYLALKQTDRFTFLRPMQNGKTGRTASSGPRKC